MPESGGDGVRPITKSGENEVISPDRGKLALLVIWWVGGLLVLVIVSLLIVWFVNRPDTVPIDTAKLLENAAGTEDKIKLLAALKPLVETPASVSAQSAKDLTQLLLTALLPLFGAWVGTVLAYYFSREGFESASRAQLQLMKQLPLIERLRQFRVSDRMVPRERMDVLCLNEEQVASPESVALQKLLDVLKKRTVTRLPILGPRGEFFCLVHNSLKDRFIAAKAVDLAANGEVVKLAELRLADLLAMPNDGGDATTYPTFGDLAKRAVAFACADKTLADAKEAMDHISGCQDVFVTRTGAPEEPVLGWLTNVEFAKAAETFA